MRVRRSTKQKEIEEPIRQLYKRTVLFNYHCHRLKLVRYKGSYMRVGQETEMVTTPDSSFDRRIYSLYKKYLVV
jgi:hypothetical protein